MNFLEYANQILPHTIASPLGIVGLLALLVSVLTLFFFKPIADRRRILVFLLYFIAACCFGAALLIKAQQAAVKQAREAVNMALGITNQPIANVDWDAPKWEEARVAIHWVWIDHGARLTYARAFATGLSKYQAVLSAQAHNSHAQQILIEYGPVRAEKYISTIE